MSAVGYDWCCCVQENGYTALMVACSKGHTDIVEHLLAVPGLNVNAANVSCVSCIHVHPMISHCYARCGSEEWQEGWVLGRAILEVDFVGGGL